MENDKTIILEKLIEVFNKNETIKNSSDVVEILSSFMYSIGQSLAEKEYQTNEEILLEYAKKPTFSNALMLQAIHMKETWLNKRKAKDVQ